MIVIVMGVSGVGKTTVGRLVGQRLGLPFVDADDHHRPEDLARMAAGIAMTDAERRPWIDRLHDLLVDAEHKGPGMVLACSALRAEHRRRLAEGLDEVRWVHLVADPAVIEQRLSDRDQGVGPSLLPSQLEALEAPSDAIVVDASAPLEQVVASVLERLGSTA